MRQAGLCNVIASRRGYGIRVGQKSNMIDGSMRRKKENPTLRGGNHIKVEAEVEVIAALSHKNQEFPAHNRSLERKEDFSLGYLLVGWPCQYLEFRYCLLE